MTLKVLNPTKWPPVPKTNYEKKILADEQKAFDKHQETVLKFKIYYRDLEDKYGKRYAKMVFDSLNLHRADDAMVALIVYDV